MWFKYGLKTQVWLRKQHTAYLLSFAAPCQCFTLAEKKSFCFHQIISIYSFTISFPAACQPIKPESSSIT